MRWLKIILAIALLAFIGNLGTPGLALAAWHADGNPVCTAGVNQVDCSIVSDNSGGAILAWLDSRGSDQDIYAQRVSSLGGVVWDTSGIAICTASGTQDHVRLVSDGAGGAIITWMDFRTSLNYDIYAQRVNSSGNVLWNVNGVPICTASWDQELPELVSDGAGGAIIVWQDSRSGTSTDIYAQRVDPLGNVLWAANGVAICTATNEQQLPSIATDGAGGGIISWSDNRGVNVDVYAQRVDAWGVGQWAPNGLAVCTALNDQMSTGIISDAAGGAIMSWVDYRSGSSFDIYAQRVTGAGVAQWGMNGVSVCTAGNDQYPGFIVPDGAGGAIICWEDFRSGSNWDVYSQRMNAVGVWQWTVNGIPICTATGDQNVASYPSMASDGSGGAIIVWEDQRGGSDSDVYSQRVDASGTIQWTNNGVLICTSSNDQHAPVVMDDGAGGAIIGWEDQRTPGPGIYGQYLNPYGEWNVAPQIASVKDIPNDQGGYVTLAWDRSSNDVWPRKIVTHYSVWRAVPQEVLLSMPESVKLVDGSDILEEFSGPGLRVTTFGTTQQYWEWIANVEGHYLDYYAVTPSTLFDSTSASNGYHSFFVSAHTDDPFVFWDSDPDSGYSVDNLAPDPPEGLAGDYSYPPAELLITWDPNTEADLSHYAVYKGKSYDFVPGPRNIIGIPWDTFFVDDSFDPNVDNYYKVSAWDIHENESGYSLLGPDEITGVSWVPSPPMVTLLEQNVPNPFNPVTVIRFSIAMPGRVTLVVFDVAGRPVRTLVREWRAADRYEVFWNGCDDSGRTVASGVYLYQLEAPGYIQSKKMVLLR